MPDLPRAVKLAALYAPYDGQVPWTVHPHPDPKNYWWRWTCDQPDCSYGGHGVNETDAHVQAAGHAHNEHEYTGGPQ